MRAIQIILLLVFLVLAGSQAAQALPEFLERTGQGCLVCHKNPGGGPLTIEGLQYAASGYVWPPEGGYRVLGPIRGTVRFFIGMVHIMTAFIWFGTILYVHLILKPAYASTGLPRSEMMLGIFSMLVVGITGSMLTYSRIRGIDVLWTSTWGMLLGLKIIVFLFMISTAVFVITWLGPRLKKPPLAAIIPEDGVFDAARLAAFSGNKGRPAFVAVGGKVFDVSGFQLWKNGMHMKHKAGGELSESLARAPHGFEKLECATEVGVYDLSGKTVLNRYQKLFYALAYLNLGLVFVVLFVIALWRWGI